MTDGSIERMGAISKETVLVALKEMKAQGLDAYETTDPRAEGAQKLLNDWWAQEEARAKGTPAAEIRASVARNLILIEAGYDDREMLDNVCEWLENDLTDAERIEDAVLVEEIKVKIAELEAKLRSGAK